MQRVSVTWVDAAGREGWEDVDTIINAHKVASVESLGFLVLDDAERIVLCSGRSTMEDGSLMQTLAIPKSCVKQIMYLAVSTPKED